MSNSMSVAKIFIIIAIIFGLGSTIDLIYSLVTLNFELTEIFRCLTNMIISLLLYLFFIKKLPTTIESE